MTLYTPAARQHLSHTAVLLWGASAEWPLPILWSHSHTGLNGTQFIPHSQGSSWVMHKERVESYYQLGSPSTGGYEIWQCVRWIFFFNLDTWSNWSSQKSARKGQDWGRNAHTMNLFHLNLLNQYLMPSKLWTKAQIPHKWILNTRLNNIRTGEHR